MDVVRCSTKGIDLFLAVNTYDSSLVEKHLEKRELKIARKELKGGLPTIHSWAVVGLWAYMESLFKNFIENWIQNDSKIFENVAIRKIQVSIGEYESLPKEQKARYIAESLEKELKIIYKPGVSKFEEYLRPFNLSGSVDKIVEKKIFELNKVRNLIAHRSCYVDKKFQSECPWLKAKIGSKLRITREMYTRYIAAAIAYCSTIICRIGNVFNADVLEYKNKINETIKLLKKRNLGREKFISIDVPKKYINELFKENHVKS